MRYVVLPFLALSLAAFADDWPLTLKSTDEVSEYALNGTDTYARVLLSGVILRTKPMLVLQDATGRVPLHESAETTALRPGDAVELFGHAWPSLLGEPWVNVKTLTVRHHGEQPKATPIPLGELDEQRHNLLPIVTEGTVIRVIPDKIDAHYQFLVLKQDDRLLPVAINRKAVSLAPDDLLDAVVRISGIFCQSISGRRCFSGPFVLTDDDPSGLVVITPPPTDPFDAPALKDFCRLSPREIARLGRQSVSGEVLATWGEDQLMLRERNGRIVNITLKDGVPLPSCGICGVAVGYAETDLLHINLSHARFKPLAGLSIATNDPPQCIEASQLFQRDDPNIIADQFHGKLLRLHGVVRTTSSASANDGFFTIESQNHRLPVDIRSHRDIAKHIQFGYEVEITARCRFETGNWRPDDVFPRISGLVLVPRNAADVRVLKRPSWWTPARLLSVIGLLLVGIAGLLARIWFQRRTARLKLAERTRLAVELHDSLSQTLAGLACQIGATEDALADKPEMVRPRLSTAKRMLQSCRSELRQCLSDLRSDILSETDFSRALARTIEPLKAFANVSVRFNVRRSLLDDSIAHATLAIVRELTANAIRHGAADSVRIAGTIDRGQLLFAVTDDGEGFDPEACAGIDEGHFGLNGIRERIKTLKGTFKIQSASGQGTRAAVTIPLNPK